MGIFDSIPGFPLRNSFSFIFTHLDECRLLLSGVYWKRVISAEGSALFSRLSLCPAGDSRFGVKRAGFCCFLSIRSRFSCG